MKTIPYYRSTAWILMLLLLMLSHEASSQSFGPRSNIVGVWRMTLESEIHLISFPVLPEENATVPGVFGEQLPGGISWENASRILTLNQDGYYGSFFNSETRQWEGTLVDLDYQHSYWLVLPPVIEPVRLELVGAVLEAQEIDMGTIYPGMNLVGAGFPVPTSLAQSDLVESGFTGSSYRVTSDRVYSWSAGSLDPVWFDPVNGWQGNWLNFEPGLGYIVVVAPGRDGFDWRRQFPEGYRPPDHRRRNNYQPKDPVLIPLPNFNQPPWGDGPPPGIEKKSSSKRQKHDRQVIR